MLTSVQRSQHAVLYTNNRCLDAVRWPVGSSMLLFCRCKRSWADTWRSSSLEIMRLVDLLLTSKPGQCQSKNRANNTDRHFDTPLKTKRIKFLPSGLLCPLRKLRKTAVWHLQPVFRSSKDGAFSALLFHIHKNRLKFDNSKPADMCEFSAATSFVFSDDMCITMQITSLTRKCPSVRFVLYRSLSS